MGEKKNSNPDAKKASSGKSWQGRLTADADAATAELVASLDVDVRLWKYDIAGSIAHAEMLSEQKILSKKEFAEIRKGLLAVADEIEAGQLPMPVELEDIHMVIEKALIDRIGPVGGKLHTGRSRNDQVALDLRLWTRDAIDSLIASIRVFQQAMVSMAEAQGEIILPAYTHLQRAQPIVAGHAMLAYVEMLQRDLERLTDARVRVNVSPLGCGAVAGTSLPLNRARTAELLGFPAFTRNSIDTTADRDFLAELAFDCAMIAVHLSRWAEDWIIQSTTEFGFIELSDAYCTSSSMMPQKKNADTLELIRGKSASAIAQLTGLLTMLKGLPLAYNRDLQDDKRFAFSTVETTLLTLKVAAGIAATAKLRPSRIARDLEEGFLDATSLAEYLTRQGVPFRQAHHIVGSLVATAEKQGKKLAEFSNEELAAASDQLGEEARSCLGTANVVKQYQPDGAGGLKQLAAQLAFWKKTLSESPSE